MTRSKSKCENIKYDRLLTSGVVRNKTKPKSNPPLKAGTLKATLQSPPQKKNGCQSQERTIKFHVLFAVGNGSWKQQVPRDPLSLKGLVSLLVNTPSLLLIPKLPPAFCSQMFFFQTTKSGFPVAPGGFRKDVRREGASGPPW